MKKILYTLLLVAVFSCTADEFQNEEPITQQSVNSNLPITKAKYSYDTKKNNAFIKQKAPEFYNKFASKSLDASSINLSWGEIKTDEALEVQEVNGFTTTSYKIESFQYEDDEIYNLVFITKDTLVSVHVYGYKMDETFKTNYHENGESLANFSGQIVSQELVLDQDRIAEIDCVEYINDLLNNQQGGNTGGSSGSGVSPGGSPSGGSTTAGATDWFDSVPVFEDENPSTSDPIDWSWVGDVGGAIGDAAGDFSDWLSRTWNGINHWLRSFCGCGKSLTVDNDYKEVIYVAIDLDEEHDCYPLAIGIIGNALSPEYIESLFGMSMEDFENVRDNHPQLFVDIMDVVMQGDFSTNRISLFRNLSQALLNDSISAENIENLLLFLEENNTDDGIAFALELLGILQDNADIIINNQLFIDYDNLRNSYLGYSNVTLTIFKEAVFKELVLTNITENTEVPWQPNSGIYNGINSLAYTDTRTIHINGVPLSQFLLASGDIISTGDYGVWSEIDMKTFYFSQDAREWFEIPDPTNYQNLSVEFIFDSFWSDFAIPFARYCTPLEDAIILIDGKNFNGVAESRATAGLFILVDLVPGGKVLKIKRKAGHTLSAASPVIKIAIDATTKTQLNLKKQWKNVIANATSARKGNFGEICTDIDFVEKGYEVVHVNRHTTIDPIGDNTGIDHIFKNPVTGEYVIVESKFHGTGGLSTLADGTRQMSDAWISDGSKTSSDRLWKAVGENLNLYNQMKPSLGVNNYERVIAYVQANGTINYKYVSESGVEINTVFNN